MSGGGREFSAMAAWPTCCDRFRFRYLETPYAAAANPKPHGVDAANGMINRNRVNSELDEIFGPPPNHQNSVLEDSDQQSVQNLVLGDSSELSIFDSDEFGNVRVLMKNDEPWFVAKDVAKALGYSNTAQAIRLHCKGVLETKTPSKGGIQNVKIIREADVYRLIMKSRLPSAERFENWVMNKILHVSQPSPLQTPRTAESGELSIFRSDEFADIRVLTQGGDPWFVAKDVALSLGYSNPRDAIIRYCKGVEKLDTLREGGHPMSIIPESDLYRLVMRSRLPSAERFQDWVTKEVLPSLRQTGQYSMDQKSPKIDFERSDFSTECPEADRLEELAAILRRKQILQLQLAELCEREAELRSDQSQLVPTNRPAPKMPPNDGRAGKAYLWRAAQRRSVWNQRQLARATQRLNDNDRRYWLQQLEAEGRISIQPVLAANGHKTTNIHVIG